VSPGARAAAGIALAAALGCHRAPAPAPAPPVALGPDDAAFPVPPPSTTSGAIAVSNLEGEIDLLSRQVAVSASDERGLGAALVGRLLLRAQVMGRLGDYDRALALAEAGVRRRPGDAPARMARARVRARLHLFAQAIEDLDAAARAGSRDPALVTLRAEVLAATGHTADAEALYERARKAAPDIGTVGAEAALVAQGGDGARADALFALARAVYRDVSPFPVAWLELQEGLHRERQGDAERARVLYQAACARLPAFVQAQAHLAGLEAAAGPEGRRRARARLAAITAGSDDPEYLGQLAGLEAEDGRAAEAEALRRRAAAGYDGLLARHRTAFLGHAAAFWLGPGRDPARASALADENARLRPTAEARVLALRAHMAASERPLVSR
jgi:hypothetical protein